MLSEAAARAIAVAAQQLRDGTRRRDLLIRQAFKDGASLREIGKAAGLHHTTIRKIVQRG